VKLMIRALANEIFLVRFNTRIYARNAIERAIKRRSVLDKREERGYFVIKIKGKEEEVWGIFNEILGDMV